MKTSYQNSATNGPHFTSDYQRKQLIRNLLQTAQILILIINGNKLFKIYYELPKFYFWLSAKTTYPKSVEIPLMARYTRYNIMW
jgi:hypothetical protein